MLDEKKFKTVSDSYKLIQNKITLGLTKLTKDNFKQDNWKYEGGDGGGITRVVNGEMLEKGGVNFSAIQGKLSKNLAKFMQLKENSSFNVCGVSLVIHPDNPFIPTIHMNIRFFQTELNWWFGGGIDLTPYYPDFNDVKKYHQQIKNICNQFDTGYYDRFKKHCDDYFYLPHRQETRGVGGIFFDGLNDDFARNYSFTLKIGGEFLNIYQEFIKKYHNKKFSKQNKEFQLYRRGRYVEFNLLYDKGTKFGLESAGRTESILMSMPAQVKWKYNWQAKKSSPEYKLNSFLKKQDWV